MSAKKRGKATTLRFVQHAMWPHDAVCEVWHKEVCIAHITAADVAGVRVVSQHRLVPHFITDGLIQIVEVRVG